MRFAVIIPAYNEEKRIGKVLETTKKYAKSIIVVDDGSSDKTASAVRRHNVLCLRHKTNLGQGAALKTGIEAAWIMGYDIVLTLDADGQHESKEIPNFIKKIKEGNNIVFGSRNWSNGVPFVRFLGNKFASVLINLLFGIYLSDITCGYMAMTKIAYKKIYWESSRYGAQTEIVAKTGKYKLKFAEIPVNIIYLDKYKGVTILDAISVLPSVIKWRFLD